jgi:fatty acid desaturase
MSTEEHDKPLIMSDEQIRRLRGIKQKRVQQKPQSNGRGVGLWLILWGFLIFAFIVFVQWAWPENLFVWICYSVSLGFMLLGTMMLASSFDEQKG